MPDIELPNDLTPAEIEQLLYLLERLRQEASGVERGSRLESQLVGLERLLGQLAAMNKVFPEQFDAIIALLEEVARNTRPDGGPDPFALLLGYIEKSTGRFKEWRHAFHNAGRPLADALAAVFEKYRLAGEFPARELEAGVLLEAFARGTELPKGYDIESLSRYAGTWKSVIRAYPIADYDAGQAQLCYRVWSPLERESHGRRIQKVTGATKQPYDYANPPLLAERKYDPDVTLYHEGLGIVGWLSFYELMRLEMAQIAYPLDHDRELWIIQDRKEDLSPVDATVFKVVQEWTGQKAGTPCYWMYGLELKIDFKAGTAELHTPSFTKARFDRQAADGGT
jgi:hypothetical protein